MCGRSAASLACATCSKEAFGDQVIGFDLLRSC